MLLSADIISYELSKRFPLKIRCDRGVMCYNPPVFLGAGLIACFTRTDVVTGPPDAFAGPNDLLLIFCDAESGQETNGNPVIHLERRAEARDVLNYLQSVFAFYAAWDRQLQRIAFETQNVQELLDVCVPLMKNDMGLLDAKLTMQAVAYYENNHAESGWDEQKQISRVIKEIREVRDIETPFKYVHGEDDPGYPTIGVNLFDGQMWIGLFFLEGVRPFRKHDLTLMGHAAKYVKYIFIHPSPETGSGFNQVAGIFRDMIARKHVELDVVKHVWSIVGFDFKDQFQCVSVEIPSDLTPEIHRYIGSSLASQVPVTVSVEYNGRIAMLINQTKASARQPGYLAGLRRHLEELHIHAGVSEICCDVFAIRNYYDSAEAALYLGLKAGSNATFFEFSRYSMEYALNHCTGDLKAFMLYPEGLVRLIDHDDNSPVSYVETLGVYLQEGRNAAKAARLLYIQRSSLLSRLEQITKLLDMDLDDPDIRLHLLLCISLYQTEKRQVVSM